MSQTAEQGLRDWMTMMVKSMIEYETNPSDELFDRIEGLDGYGRAARMQMNKEAGITMNDWEIDRANTIMRIEIRDALEGKA
jgi:hypothetical protein